MARYDDQDPPWTRQLLAGVVALVTVALVIGGVFSVVALGAAKFSGLGGDRPTATRAPSLYIPSGTPTTRPEPYPDPTGSRTRPPRRSPTASPTRRARQAITLRASPPRVPAQGRIDLTGSYRRGTGARLQVQRLEGAAQDQQSGHWVDFPVTVSVTGGRFHTYIYTGRVGANRFRVLDPATGRASNPVRVRIG